ncbi:MAG: DUF433 domain-containing protein [Candidatus Omnitrophota bacterium]|nr:DUF433 domain-containing protein [Candidatus Omnitrophota bacterium]
MERFQRITVEPHKLGGQACIRGLRIPVHLILDLLAAGETPEAILRDYPDLELADIHEAIDYAAWLAREESFPLPSSP